MKKIIGIFLGIVIVGGAWYMMTKPNSHESETSIANKEGKKMQIVTSIYPLEYIANRIVGGTGRVINIGEGRDPHDFRPSVQDIQKMVDADMVILQGADLEPWGDDMQHQLEQENVPVFIASEQVELFEIDEEEHDEHDEDDHDDEHEEEHADEKHEEEDDHGHGSHDPHTWLQPMLMSQIAEEMTKQFSRISPENKVLYESNLTALQKDLSAIDAEYTKQLSQCALEEVIVSHDAFGYIARSYKFEMHTISGLSTQDTPSAVTLGRLKEEAAEGINMILLEKNNIKNYGEVLARETGLETGLINPIVSNIPAGKDYLDLMRLNLSVFKTALNCNE